MCVSVLVGNCEYVYLCVSHVCENVCQCSIGVSRRASTKQSLLLKTNGVATEEGLAMADAGDPKHGV